MLIYEGKELAENAITTLKALKLEFEKFWTNVTASAEKLKRQAQPRECVRNARHSAV